MKLELITTQEQFEALQPQWNSLLPGNATNEIFLTWEWQSTWWQVYQRGTLWVVAAYEDNELVGIAPWFMEHPNNIIRTIGCVEVTDYLDVLVLPRYREAFYIALADFLVEQEAEYAAIDLCNIPVGTPTLDLFPLLLSERGFAVEVKHEDVCPYIVLPKDFDAYIDSLDKKNRHELRRKLRRAEVGENETVEWYIVDQEHDLNAEIERFLTLMAASHPDKERFITDSQNKAFFRAIMPRLFTCGWLQLSFITVNGEAAAAYLNFDYNNKILVYNSGLLPSSYAYLSPGIVLLAYNIQHAISQGREVFDFLQGNEEYKYRMGAQDREVKMLEATLQSTLQSK